MQLNPPFIFMSLDKARWQDIVKQKIAFISDGVEPDVPEPIKESWKISKDAGVDSFLRFPIDVAPEYEKSDIIEENKLLVDIVIPFIKTYDDILLNSQYRMALFDKNGYFISDAHNPVNGIDYRETSIGTTAHALAIRHKRPVQIMGPVNYSRCFENNITSAAPIFNEYGAVAGCIVLVQFEANSLNMLEHSLGWVTATAHAISSQLRLLRRDERLTIMDQAVKATFAAHSREPFFSIDDAGYIINFNNKAAKLLGITKKSKESFMNMLTDPSPVERALKTGQAAINEPLILNSQTEKIYHMNIEPLCNINKKRAYGAVIRVATPEKGRAETPSANRITFDDIRHSSSVMQKLIHTAKIVAKNPLNILLLGESGTGKEMFAQAIHNAYNPSGPFVAINCASIPKNLIESELFGYEKGAFTGADKDGRKGKIEYANGGTLFLDEIGDMPLSLQPVFLRVLEERVVYRLGGHKAIPVNFRIIAATNKPLFEQANRNRFRPDLYFRLAVVNLDIPPLRERGDDVLLLAEEFAKRACARFDLPDMTLSLEAQKIIRAYDWPGNVRQLENAMTYAASFASDDIIRPEDLPKEIKTVQQKFFGKRDEAKKLEIENAIKETGNAVKAAPLLGMSVATLYRKLKKYNINPKI